MSAMSYPVCTFCGERETKYSCITCNLAICNVCSVSADTKIDGYNEEDKKVGFCKKCSPENEVVEISASKREPPTKKQRTIHSLFGVPEKSRVSQTFI